MKFQARSYVAANFYSDSTDLAISRRPGGGQSHSSRAAVRSRVADACGDHLATLRQHLHGFSYKSICLKMESQGVLLYRSDEHISPPPARQHIHSAYRGRFDENWTVKQANLISVWEERHTRWAEDLSPLEDNDFEFNTEYYEWYLENGKPFLVFVEAGNKWRENPQCSKHRDWPTSWDLVEEQPPFGTSWNSVEEQPSMYASGSSSQPTYTDDGGYIPQMDDTSITGSSFHLEQMHGTPPSMQVDDQWFNDEQTPDQPRRIVRPPKRYDQTSSLHRQELPRRKYQ
ncbi:hypothetical protein V6N11_075404 [Hibiscus sabdariffa]|uniref:Uncharacterized protein n=1 Tax=Hibiscus sabdariffa TaxID=183260 RepID=A0ABR2R6U0_9ROSI